MSDFSHISNDELLRWMQARHKMPPGTFKTYEEMLKEFAKKRRTKRLIRRFLALKPAEQQQVLSSVPESASYPFRRMLGPEWTKEEDLAIEKAGREMWPDILAYVKANP